MVGGVSACAAAPRRLGLANAASLQMMEIPLKGRGPFTVFAPTSEAFQQMKKGKVPSEPVLPQSHRS